jgi:hypothetical protein
MSSIASRGGDSKKNRAIGTQRIGDLNAIFARRYGGDRGSYVFPDDDAGREDLAILLHHYALNNPLAMPRIIQMRAPWMSSDQAEQLIIAINAAPQRWTATRLGQVLRCTRIEWQELRTRTIAPIDMTKAMRRRYSNALARDRKTAKRRAKGVAPRAANITNTKPWEAFGIGRATWYRWGKPVSWEAVRQLGRNKDYLCWELLVSSLGNGLGEQGCCKTPAVKPANAPVLQEPSPLLAPPNRRVDQLSRAELEASFAAKRRRAG